jgi:hypothetical protein
MIEMGDLQPQVVVRTAVSKVRKFYDQYAPWISLGLGVLARAFSHKGVDFAPKAVALVALAWILPMMVTRWLGTPGDDETSESRFHRFLRTGSPVVTVLLYKNVLFFLVPIWFGSAHVLSINVVVPLVLAAMAVFTCFSRQYRERVLERPRRRVIWTATVLFAALVPATAVVAFTSPRTSIIISALVAAVVAWVALAEDESILSKKGVVSALAVALPVAGVLGLAAPIFPPVPMVCYGHGVGTGIVKRELEGQADVFPAGTARVYAWFAVTLPNRDRQEVIFQWFHEGKQIGQGLRTSVTGGRKEGFRTWSLRNAPAPGSWRVDMLTGRSSQLIGRTRFEVAAQ